MAIIHPYFLSYLSDTLRNSTLAFDLEKDPILELAELCISGNTSEKRNLVSNSKFDTALIKRAKNSYNDNGIIGLIDAYFGDRVLHQFVDSEVERKVIVLKKGYKTLPSTKAATIFKGFGYDLTNDQILIIYASYGLVHSLKELVELYDFMEINKRIEQLSCLLKQANYTKEKHSVQNRYNAIRGYFFAGKGERKKTIENSGLSRSLFFYHLKNFNKYGVLGLIDKGVGIFRNSKVGLANEAQMVLDKIQYPLRPESFYVDRMQYKKIKIDRSSVSKIFSRWEVTKFESAFISNLERLESLNEPTPLNVIDLETDEDVDKYVDINFIPVLKGMKKTALNLNAPGLLVLWVYLEELGIQHILNEMGLTSDKNGYSWFDLFLLNVARIFYGIPSYSHTCNIEEPSLSFFSHLVKLPCNDSFLNGLSSITEKQTFDLQRWLVQRVKALGLTLGKRIIFDFNQIDLDVDLNYDRLRQFGKGPSPKKKICCNGFRPHIAWDFDTGNIIIAEFRKGSARGTSTLKPFVKDFLKPVFGELFEEVYFDSEYSGKDSWGFVLDTENGMGAELTACLKLNPFVKKHVTIFLLENINTENFWSYWDDNHVITSETFDLVWEYKCPGKEETKETILHCVVKKNIKTGKLRCFGTSKENMSPEDILKDYSCRWTIENGIKDLIYNFFFDKCPGTEAHPVNIHFLIISICRHIYKMIQKDAESFIKNSDGSIKSLGTMRDHLFKQGSSEIKVVNDTIEVQFLNSFSVKLTNNLNDFYKNIHKKSLNGLSIIGGFKLKFLLRPPYGDERKNAHRKTMLSPGKIIDE